MQFHKAIALSIVVLFCLDVSSQTDQQEYYIWFDSQVGAENTGVFNGTRYKEMYRVRNEKHKFYQTNEFLKGNVHYFNQSYYDIDVKYDIFEDRLIGKLYIDLGSSLVLLIKEDIQEFQIDGKTFTHLKNEILFKSPNKLSGFYETLFQGKQFKVIKKHKKIRNEIFDKNLIYSEFKTHNEYFVSSQNVYHKLKTKSDVIKLFSNHKKLVNTYFSDNKHLSKTDYERFIIQLTKMIEAKNHTLKPVN